MLRAALNRYPASVNK